MADGGQEDGSDALDLFDILTQDLVHMGADELPEVDQLFSQVPLPSDFDCLPTASENPKAKITPSRFGPVMCDTDIAHLQTKAVPVSTRWRDWADYLLNMGISDLVFHLEIVMESLSTTT